MTARRFGFWLGLAAFAATLVLPAPEGMPAPAWPTLGLALWMAAWWMTEALPLSVTAMLPFIVLPLAGVADANKTASAYYTPIMFLFLGGAFLGLTVERTGMHRRLARFVLAHAGQTRFGLLFSVMAATALISMFISNTSTAFIMMPMALAMLSSGGVAEGRTDGMSGALPMGVAFAATIGGYGTIVGTPTNAIAAGLLREALGMKIGFAEWLQYGLPLVVLAVPLAALIVARVQRLNDDDFDPVAAREAIAGAAEWSTPERRLLPVFLLAVLAWVTLPWTEPLFPKGGITDGTIAAIAGIALFILPDGTGRRLLNWDEANRAPWGVLLMFGGGLSLAMGMSASGLDDWLGQMLLPLRSVPLPVVVLVVVAFVVLVTEFASNVAAASGIMPVVAALVVALDADPVLLAMPAALAASWGFMLPAGTGPNALAWSTGRIALPRVLKAGLLLDLAGVLLMVGVVWAVAALN